jgi:hypothetical protein
MRMILLLVENLLYAISFVKITSIPYTCNYYLISELR